MLLSSIAHSVAFNAAPVAVPSGYSMKAKGTEGEIYLYGDVGDSWFGGVTAKQFSDDLKALGNVDTISLRINSPGGDVFDGLTIYRLLVDHKAKVNVHIDGLAASIASVIAMAGDTITISESGFAMIHDAWGVAIGSAADMRQIADLLDKTTGSIRDVYVSRTGNKADDVKNWMAAETWLDANEALDKGFATAIADNMKVAAKFDPSKHKFKHAPAALAGTPNADAARQRIAAMKLRMDRRKAA